MGKSKLLSFDDLVLQGGTFLLALLVLVPFMNCVQLLSDRNLGFWVGTGFASGWMMCCFLLVLGYWFTMKAFQRKASEQFRTPSTAFMMLRTFLGLLGLMLICQKFQVEAIVNEAATVLSDRCEVDGRSSTLHSYQRQLQSIRNDANCATQFSVEQCTGWVSNDWTRYLRWVEGSFQCTGVCPDTISRLTPVEPEVAAAPAATPRPFVAPAPPAYEPVQALPGVEQLAEQPALPVAATSLAHRDHRLRRHTARLTRLSLAEEAAAEGGRLLGAAAAAHFGAVSPRGATLGTVMGAGAGAGGPGPLSSSQPNALFSKAHYDHKCGTMIAMDLRNRGQSLADTTFANGIALFIVMIFSAALELSVFVSKGEGKPAVLPPERRDM